MLEANVLLCSSQSIYLLHMHQDLVATLTKPTVPPLFLSSSKEKMYVFCRIEIQDEATVTKKAINACIILCSTFTPQIRLKLCQYVRSYHNQLWYIINFSTTLVVCQKIHTILTGIHHQQQHKPSTSLECTQYCYNCIVFLDLRCVFGFNMVFLYSYCVNKIMLYTYRILSLASKMGIYSLPVMQNLVWCKG